MSKHALTGCVCLALIFSACVTNPQAVLPRPEEIGARVSAVQAERAEETAKLAALVTAGDVEGVGASVDRIASLRQIEKNLVSALKTGTESLHAGDPVWMPGVKAGADTLSLLWPPLGLVSAAIASWQTYRRRKAEAEAEGGEVIAQAIEAADREAAGKVKAAVLARQEKQGKGKEVSALLRRAKV